MECVEESEEMALSDSCAGENQKQLENSTLEISDAKSIEPGGAPAEPAPKVTRM